MGFSAKNYTVHVPTMDDFSSDVVDYKYKDHSTENVDFNREKSQVEVLEMKDDLGANSLHPFRAPSTNHRLKTASRVGATAATGVISVGEGVGQFGEAVMDTGAIIVTGLATPFTFLGDKISGTHDTEKMWDDTKAFVSTNHVKNAFDKMYDNTAFGNYLKENAYGFDTTRQVGNIVGYSGAVIATAGIGGSIAGVGGAGISPIAMGGTAAFAGFSRHSAHAWNDGASTTEGLGYGAAGAAWEGLQWYAGGKISQVGGWGDKLGVFINNSSQGARIASRIGLNSLDGGLEGFVQPGLSLIYKDYGEKNVFDNYSKAFGEAGGMKNVTLQTALAGGMSTVGEIGNLRRLLSSNEDNFREFNVDLCSKRSNKTYLKGIKAAQSKFEGFFRNFREHASKHSGKVQEYAVKLAKEYDLSESQIGLISISAKLHDLGMMGGWIEKKQVIDALNEMHDLPMDKVDDLIRSFESKNSDFVKIDDLSDSLSSLGLSESKLSEFMGIRAREAHPLNSALIILETDYVPTEYDKEIAAILAMSHSKSTSGIGCISEPEMWEGCVRRLESALSDSGKSHLFDSKKILDMIHDPNRFLELQDAALCIRDGDAMAPIVLDENGRTVMQNMVSLDTNVDATRVEFNETPYTKNNVNTLGELKAKESEQIIDLMYNKDGSPRIDPVSGKQAECTNVFSKRVHAGEKNLELDSHYSKNNGMSEYSGTVKVIDPRLAPGSTVDAIFDSVGEVATYTNCDTRTLTIELPTEMKGTELGNWYESEISKMATSKRNKFIDDLSNDLSVEKASSYEADIKDFFDNRIIIKWN